jgi:ribosome-associated protein
MEEHLPMANQPPLLDKLLHALDEIQAFDIKVIDVSKHTSITDYMIIVSARASRHAKAIAHNVMEVMKPQGLPSISCSGMETGDWVLIDFGDFILHIMLPESRDFYNLEGLWEERTGS